VQNLRNPGLIAIALLALAGCASQLDPISLPPEYAPEPANSQIWQDLQEVRDDDWYFLLNRGAPALDWRIRAIDSATRHIDLQSFIWEFDTVGDLILGHLLAAAERGVRVRVLLDDSFIATFDASVSALMAHPNIEYRIFNPYKRRSNNMVTREILNLGEFHRLDHRMHNKSMVVDNRIAIIGGRNIADEYFGWHKDANFRDMEVLLGGSSVQEISRGFDLYWNNQWSFPAAFLGEATSAERSNAEFPANNEVRLTDNNEKRAHRWQDMVEQAVSGSARLLIDEPPGRNPADPSNAPVQLAEGLNTLIDSAVAEIRIISAYLVPTPEFESAIERAESRGVEVHILTNSIRSNNHITAHSAYRKHIRQLLDHGADLYEVRVDADDRGTYMQAPLEFKELALHAKIMIVDEDKVFLGSANFDPRSLRINTEMGLIIESEALNQQLQEAVQPDFQPRNAWHLKITDAGQIQWISDDQILNKQPAQSFMQEIEDWFFAHMPIEGEM
jgi:putative cardiolipin synthase